MSAFELFCLFRAEVADGRESAWGDDSQAGVQAALRRAALDDALREAARLLAYDPNAAASALDVALGGCVEAWLLQWQIALDPEEDVLAAIERYAPLLALRVQWARRAAHPRERLRGCIEVFHAVFGVEPRRLAPRDECLDAGSARPEPAALAMRR